MIIANPGVGMMILIVLFFVAVGWEFWRGE